LYGAGRIRLRWSLCHVDYRPPVRAHARARVHLNGAGTVSKTVQRKADAQKWAQETEVAIWRDEHAITRISRRTTLVDRSEERAA
jgi:hypothetical protein